MHWSDRRASVAVPDSLSYARMARIGASRPLPRVAATVCFLITERALSLVGGNRSSCPLRDLADGLGSAATAENRFRPTTGYAAARFANSVTAEGTEARAVSIAAARCSGPRARPSALLAADGDRPLINLVGAIWGSRERGARSTPPRGRIHRRTRCRRRVPATGAPFRRSCEHPPRREYASGRP